MKRTYTILALLTICIMSMAQGIRIKSKNGGVMEEWNYNDFDSIVVEYSKEADLSYNLPELMKDNPKISLFAEALYATGLSDEMQKWRDVSWNPDWYEPRSIYVPYQWDYCHIPQTRYFKFTAFACPDSVLKAKYGITDLASLYGYAQKLYGGDSWNTVAAQPEKMKEATNPLRRLMAYNCLKSYTSYDMFTTICTIATEMVDPTEWYATLDGGNLMKMERLTVSRYIGEGETKNDLYLNRCNEKGISGVHVLRPEDDSTWRNGGYYLTDGLADFSEQTRQTVFNTRIRMDLYTMFPEMLNNDIRDGRTTNRISDSNNPDPSVTSPNYWFPNGYIDGVKVNEDGYFFFQSQHNTYWSYEGDEFGVASDANQFDLEVKLPKLPEGTYQLRLGYNNMQYRPTCQFYVDGEPVGVPLDMSDKDFENRSGWFALRFSGEEAMAKKTEMHNRGWYHGPKSVFSMSGEGHPDGSNNRGTYFCDLARTVRYIIGTFPFKEGEEHTLRIHSVYAVGTCVLQLDYLEFVPQSVFEGDEDDL